MRDPAEKSSLGRSLSRLLDQSVLAAPEHIHSATAKRYICVRAHPCCLAEVHILSGFVRDSVEESSLERLSSRLPGCWVGVLLCTVDYIVYHDQCMPL